MRSVGIEPKSIRHRVATRRLHVIHHKVYAVGHERRRSNAPSAKPNACN
jgi:hypothetical protein